MPNHPTLRVDTAGGSSYNGDASFVPASPSSPRSPSFGTFSRDRARSISQSILPSFRISSVSGAGNSNDIGSSPPKHSLPPAVGKARNESRKLLAHILSQLQSRPVPPPLLAFASGHSGNGTRTGSVIKSVKGAVGYTGTLRERRTHQPLPQDDTDSEDETSEEFTTDTTYDLLNQLKDVLVLSIAHSWDIFYDSTPQNQRSNSDKIRESFMRRRSLSVGRSSRSRSPSMGRGEAEGVVRAPQLLSQCISILASIITEDCRFKVSSPRPFRPPNSLQSIALDVGRLLLHTHRHDPRVISQVAFAILPAFMTFGPEMYPHLLKFFDDGVLGNVLADLRNLQGTVKLVSPTADLSYSDSMSNVEPPMVSILVDEVKEDSAAATNESSWRRWMRALSPDDVPLRATSAPLQDVAIYHLSSIVPPLFAVIFDNIDLVTANSSTIYRFHLLISRIVESKPDTYLDLLTVIAYHTPRARYAAISVLLSYWPHALGHLTASKPFPFINYHDAIARETRGGPHSRRHRSHPYSHQFVPWRVGKAFTPNVFTGFSQYDCHACGSTIEGLALLCPLCMCIVHFNCYDDPDGSFFTQYSIAADPSMQKVAVHRFCHIVPQRNAASPEIVHKEQHAFRPVNMFSLTLCFICRKPLWGPVAQAFKCGSCNQFVHPRCLTRADQTTLPGCRSVIIDDTYMTISWEAMRESFADHYREVFLTQVDLPSKTYEEISVFLAVLWVQLQILLNGLALGSIVVKQSTPAFSDTHLDEFELHYLVELYEAYLSSSTISVSQALSDHLVENRCRASHTHLCFNWSVLTYVVSIIKVPATAEESTSTSADLLTATQPGHVPDSFEDSAHPYEVLTLAHLRDQLGDQINLHSEAAARYFLSHLFHLGFIQRVDYQSSLFDGGPHPEHLQCSFPLPIGLEMSTEVETLVVSIEACLSDIDLSVNEAGFLLLVRKFWPDGMLTEYALRRLCKAVLGWIMSEDDHLAAMLRDYVARGLTLPGVRSGSEMSWPASTQPRQAATSSANNGGDYVAARRGLLARYAAKWLLALHDQDMDCYAVMIFDLLIEQAQELPVRDEFLFGKKGEAVEKKEATVTEKVLHLILKLSQASVLFTTFDDLFQKWLNRASSLDVDHQTYIASLSKLFNKELETSQRFTMVADPRLTLTEIPSMLTINPLKVITEIANKSNEGYDSTLHWLCLFVRSGVEISVATFMQLVQLGNRFGVSLEVCSLLVKAALWSCWLKSMGRQDLQTVIAAIHTGIGPQLVVFLRAQHMVFETLQVIRQSVATCLLLYGCGRSFLLSSGLILESEIQGLPSRRKMNARNNTITDPIIVNSALIDALRTYVETELEDVACVAVNFLDAFMHQASLVETYEVDNFILRNGSSLCTCMWQFYSVQRAEISMIRTKVLLRILVVDAQPFESLLENLFDLHGSWEVRLQAVVRLFRIIQDVTSPSFSVEDRQWRSSVTCVFRYFFGALWEDDREEIRLAVETWTQTLLDAHFEGIALCWDEALSKSPVSDRTKLISFLNQLRPHFPHWRLLSWQVILEALLEGEFVQKNGDDEDGPMSAHLSMYGLPSSSRKTMFVDSDLQALQNSLISLTLRMIAEGIPIDITSLLRFKEHLAKTLGFAEVAAVSAPGNGNSFYVRFGGLDNILEAAYPCLNELMLTLDSPQPYGLVPSAMGARHLDDEAPASLLVGSIFVDLFLEAFIHCDNLESLPALTVKNLLKSLIIVIYKHDFDSRPLKPHQGTLRRAVKRALDLLLLDISYDLRQLVLTVCHAFIKRWPNLIGNFVCDTIESTISLMEKLKYQQNGDDILIDQTKNFLRTILGLYAFSGAFYLLCKRRRTPEFFAIIRHITGPQVKAERNPHPLESLRDALLRDTLTRAVEGDDESLQVVVDNINTYVEVVHHTEYPLTLMQFVGLCLASLTRKTADLHHSRFDPSPLLLVACTLIQHNKAHSRDLLLYLETLLRASLNRFNVSTVSLRKVLQVTTTLYRKAAKVAGPNAQDALVNPLTAAMLEITKESLNVKARVTPATLAALIEALTVNADRGSTALPTFIPLEVQVLLAADGLFYLFVESSPDGLLHSDFVASQAVARMVLQGTEIRPAMLSNVGKNPMAVRVWNILVLAALSRPSGTAAALLFEHFSEFSLAYCSSLAPYYNAQLSDPEIQDRAHADVSSAYASIKLWLLLARKAASLQPGFDTAGNIQDGEGQAANMVWNELWPPFEMVLAAFEADARAGHSSPLSSTVWSSVADLFLFVRQSRSVVALDTVVPATILNRLKDVVRGESKVTRVVRSLKDAPPDDSLDYFVGQMLTEITAEEKLQAAKRQINVERGRRTMS